MKHLKNILLTAIATLALTAGTLLAAFPTDLGNYQSGDTIFASIVNNIETKIGITDSTDTNSLDYKVRHIKIPNDTFMTAIDNAGTGVVNIAKVTTGDIIEFGATVAGIELETTTSSDTGVIYKGTNRFIHNFDPPDNGTVNPAGQNTFIGIDAGNFTMGSTATANHQGSYNTGAGQKTLYSNTTGYSNSAMGVSALRFNTTGCSNSALGVDALFSNTTGHSNSAVGLNAGRYIDGGGANQTSNNSVYIGYDTRASADGNTNENVFGYGAVGVGSNSVVLGNDSILTTVLKGDVTIADLSGTGNSFACLDSAGILYRSATACN